MSRENSSRWIERIWYSGSLWYLLLIPLSWIFALATGVRRLLYRQGLLASIDIGSPVIVVGNITSGGTGKTPVTLWLARRLRERGFHPGIVSRGYGGRVGDVPIEVSADSDAGVVGDEPLLMAKRRICPVVVHPDRVSAARVLANSGCDVVIADDGLQHYRLKRHFEIAVVDGNRGFGNGHLLPAGPLREPVSRLRSVDEIMLQDADEATAASYGRVGTSLSVFELAVSAVHDLQRSQTHSLDVFRGRTVNAMAAIGNP
jgi:tetraacyldisaccharide 4'-kinase